MKSIFRAISLFAVVIIFFITTTAVVIRHDKADSDYQMLATNYPAVGTITSSGQVFCTCTLVAPDMVLTAAHCIDDNGDGMPDNPNEIMNAQIVWGNDMNAPTHSVGIDTFYINPQWFQSGALNRKDGNDMALIKLASPITDIVPMQISIQNPVGLVGTTVGYGATANGNTTPSGTIDGKKRAGQNLIEYKSPLSSGDENIGALHGDFDSPDGSTNTMEMFMLEFFGITHISSAEPLEMEGFGWGGDSGGPVAVDFSDGSGNVIVGVASSSFNPLDGNAPCGYGAIDIWSSFLNPGNAVFFESHGLELHGGDPTAISTLDAAKLNFVSAPNPFVSSTSFQFKLSKNEFVELTIFNANGQQIKLLIAESLTEGSHQFNWNPKNISAGIYFYQLRVGAQTLNGKLIYSN